MTAIIAASKLTAGYGELAAVRDIDIEVHAGEVIALLGANGVGKTTLLLTLAGDLKPLSGSVLWEGEATRAPLHRRALQGLALVTEERSVVTGLSVRDNLRLAHGSEAVALDIFPALRALSSRRAGLLSGGEQQMLAVGRAIGRRPKALLVDELSLGLAPVIADRLAQAIRRSADEGLAVLLVEQNLQRALAVSDRFYLLKHGEIALSKCSSPYRANADELRRHFFEAADNDAMRATPLA